MDHLYSGDLELIRRDLAAIPEEEREFLFVPEEECSPLVFIDHFEERTKEVNAFLDATQYSARDELYTKLLVDYIENNRERAMRNQSYRRWFFVLTMALCFGAVIFMAVIAVVMVARKPETSTADLGIAATAAASLISAIIVLPKTIAAYLFPANEDELIIRLVEKMQENDARLRHDNL